MLQLVVRIFFVLALLSIGMSYMETESVPGQYRPYFVVLGVIFLAAVIIAIDATIPRKSLQALSGVFFGLVVGMVISRGLNLVIDVIVAAYFPASKEDAAVASIKVLVGVVACYLCVSFILQTKDDIRFVIPYVEFAKQVKGQHPLILDTSVLIDGRIVDVCATGIIDQPIIVPRFVLSELQSVADSPDKLKRARGRRGLDVLHKLQSDEHVEVEVLDAPMHRGESAEPVDLKLLSLAQRLNARLATNDYNLNKLAKVRGIAVINVNDLAAALRPVVLPGESMSVKLIKPGEEPGQGVGYLDDGTMVVVDQGRSRIGERVSLSVTSVLQTSAGRMIFGKLEPGGGTAPSSGTQENRRAAPSGGTA